MRPDLVRWQWSLYPDGHRDRVNLILHILTWPLFVGGVLSIVASPLLGWRAAVGGLVGMIIAMVAQGRGHKREQTAPVPFLGPGDVISRLVVEQLFTFPRYVLSGRFFRALASAGQASGSSGNSS